MSTLKEPYESRRRNLLEYRNSECDRSTAILAKKLDINKATLEKFLLLTENARVIHGNEARSFEVKLGLSKGYLDHTGEKEVHTYFVVISVQSRHALDVLKWLRKFPEIQEAAGTFGSFDLIAKLEVEEPKALRIVVGEIGSYPGVIRTETHLCINDLYWKRESKKSSRELPIDEIPSTTDNYAEKYISEQMHRYFREIELLDKGEAQAHDQKDNDIDRIEMIGSAKKTIRAIRLPDDVTQCNGSYLEAEKRCIAKQVQSQRILILEENFHERWKDICNQYYALSKIGCSVKFIFESKWIEAKETIRPTDFLIVDDDFVYIRETYGSRINKTREVIEKYKNIFTKNWQNATIDFAEVERVKRSL